MPVQILPQLFSRMPSEGSAKNDKNFSDPRQHGKRNPRGKPFLRLRTEQLHQAEKGLQMPNLSGAQKV
jgi:hypothetical protein